MSEYSVRDDEQSFDVEAQQAYSALLLHGQEEEEEEEELAAAPDVSDHDHQVLEMMSTRSTQILMRAIVLVVHSIELFKSSGAANHNNNNHDDVDSTSYSAISNPEEIILNYNQDTEVAETYVDIDKDENKQEHNIELQSIQRRNEIKKIVKDKDLRGLQSFGGVRGVAEALNTDLENGISSDQEYILQQKRNQQSQVSIFLHSFLGAWNNYIIFLLSVAAVLSLTFGIKKHGLAVNGLIDGVIVIGTIFFIVVIKTVRNYLQKMTCVKHLETYWLPNGKGNLTLKSSCNNMRAQVTRGGNQGVVHIIDLRVGDLVHLKKGSLVPADGIYIAGETVQVDGELRPTIIDETNPFLFYGSRVINGNASMIVTSVGVDTVWGEMMSQTVMPPNVQCKFAACFDKVNTYIQITGILIIILINITLFVRYVLGKNDNDSDNGFRTDIKGEPTPVIAIMDAIKGTILGTKLGTTGVLTLFSVSLVGITEGIPVVISFAVLLWNYKTLTPKAQVRDYLSCIKMASITTICTDKLGGLTEHEHEVDKFLVGEELISESSQVASPDVLEGLCDGIGTILMIPPTGCAAKMVPIISWAEANIGLRKGSINEQCKILKMNSVGGNPFEENCGVVMEKIGNDGRSFHLHCKGPPLKILSLCSEYYDNEGSIRAIDVQKRRKFENVIRYNLVELEVVAFACREIVDESDDASVSLTLLGMIALKHTKREEIKKAVLTLKEGGIRTILASGDDVAVLQTIGENCRLISPTSDDLVLTAEEYRAWNDEEKKDRVGKICIIGNCLQSDKIDLIKCLKEKGEVVAVLGQRTLDAPALKVADIGLTFGSWSSKVAREYSGISIFHGDFSFLVHVIEKGKGFHENTRKFIQLQLIFTVSSLLINFIATVLWGDAPLTTIQLIWLNLVLVFVGGLAVLTGQPIGVLMDIVPIKSCRRLITKAMCRNIFIQAFYQTIVLLTLQCKGQSIFGISDAIVKSMIYKGFCLCQFFNIFIAREYKSKNIFKGLFQKNEWFFVALVLFVLFQAAFLVAEKFLGGTPFLNCKLFGVCLLIGLVSWLLDSFGKFISSLIARWAANPAAGSYMTFRSA